MNVIDPGHVYELDWLDVEPGLTAEAIEGSGARLLTFVKREGERYPGNVGHHAGTNMQEVLRALIHRTKYVDAQQPDGRNNLVVRHLRGALLWLEDRAAVKHGRTLDPVTWNVDREIESDPTCSVCGHVGHEGGCRS